jgi:hypothetical protein
MPLPPNFNSGVLVMDLDRWRAESIGTETLRYVADQAGRIAHSDQTALNAVLRGRWLPLHPRWNLQALHSSRERRAIEAQGRNSWKRHVPSPQSCTSMGRASRGMLDVTTRTPPRGGLPLRRRHGQAGSRRSPAGRSASRNYVLPLIAWSERWPDPSFARSEHDGPRREGAHQP